MRSGLSTIQQTLTPEASTVLSHSISEASRRNHSQVTPLHVAATLLTSPSSFLRQACIRSHPNSSHPLQCRALELCFSVALDRLPMTQSGSDSAEPPISNALMAALKRAQAHQRRGCPEQQQQPLLAVKVELEQLIISILDDPSVSRVMREARFSSPAVKATIEKSMNSSSNCNLSSTNSLGFRPSSVPVPSGNMYLNPRLQQNNVALGLQFGQPQPKIDEEKWLIEIMSRSDKRNPVLVGDSELESVLKRLFAKIENNELNGTALQKVQLVHIEKETVLNRPQLPEKMKEMGDLIMDKCDNGYGVILNLGDLKWLVEQPSNGGGVPGWAAAAQPVVSEVGRLVVEQVRKLLRKFGSKLWLVGTASCETYMRCQVYYNSMESDWGLQAVPIATRVPPLSTFPRHGTTGFFGNLIQPVTPLKSYTPSMNSFARPLLENLDPASKMTCCPQCKESYEKELANVPVGELQMSLAEQGKPLLPTWLRTAKITDQQLQETKLEKRRKLKIEELTKKWNETCSRVHRSFNHVLGSEDLIKPSTPSMTSLLNPKLLNPKLIAQQNFQPKSQPQRSFVEARLQLNPALAPSQSLIGLERAGPSPPRSPVRTELVLGRSASPQKNQNKETEDFMSCNSSGPQNASIEMQANKLLSSLLDVDWLTKLMKTLTDKVWWQREAASAVATAVAQCKLGNGKQGGVGSNGNVWLLFTGPDRIGKKKMASALSDLICGLSPVVISFGLRQSDDTNMSFRGKTALDRIGEAIRRNPFSVVMLEDIDEADMLIRSKIKWAMERGRITDSHGRELTLGNVTFILTSNWLPEEFKMSSNANFNTENNLIALACENRPLKLTISEKTGKKRLNQTTEYEHLERSTKFRTDINSVISFDLNEAVDTEDYRANGSGNSSDLTAEPDEDSGNVTERYSFINQATHELLDHVDSAIVFDTVDFSSIRQRIASSISTSFSTIIHSDKASIHVEEGALEKILSGIWLCQISLEDWLEDVLVPSLGQLKTQLQCHTSLQPIIIQLEIDDTSIHPDNGESQELLPSSIRVATSMQ